MFIVIYAKIVDGKRKNDIIMNGPFCGPEVETMDEAHDVAKSITLSSKDIVLIRIYDLDDVDYNKAMDMARSAFQANYNNMLTVADIINNPSKFKKRKKKKIAD